MRIGEQRIERRRRGSPAKNFFGVEYAIPDLYFNRSRKIVSECAGKA
jgi:hypothetical protein